MRMALKTVLGIAAAVIFLCSCSQAYQLESAPEVTEKVTETEEVKTMENATYLAAQLGIEDDCAQGLRDELSRVGAAEIVRVESIVCKHGYQATLTDADDNVYFIALGDLGYLELICRDSPDGEILYAAID